MIKNIYDIVIIGSGLSALASLLRLLESDFKLKICIISSTLDDDWQNLNKTEIKYFNNNNNKISSISSFKSIDSNVLKSSKFYNTNLIQATNFGGLAEFWGSGYFPFRYINKSLNDKRVAKFIEKNFSISINKKIILNKNTNKEIAMNQFIENECKFFINNGIYSNSFELLKPSSYIKYLAKKYKIKIYNEKVNSFQKEKSSDFFKISLKKSNIIKSKYIILGCGIINTTLLLKNSGIISNEYLFVSDHKMYRVPLFNFSNFINIFKNKDEFENESFISSLHRSFTINLKKRSLFIGFYNLKDNFLKLPPIINFLIKYKFLSFSQIYLSSLNQSFTYRIDINKKTNFKQTLYKDTRIYLNEIIRIVLLFIKNGFLPLPYKYELKFGSSYHLYGSLKNEKFDIDDSELFKKLNLEIIDSSTLNSIDSEPSSYLLIKNSFLRTENILRKIEKSS